MINQEALEAVTLKISRHTDLVLAGLVVFIIALLILPMPTELVDGLLAINLSIGVTLLMLSLYISSALSLSVFPTLLLFTTLYRLALNITTTRLILLNADAGQIITTFGNFVVAGNFVVGAVVFLILTIVQFLVIAKGAERVAEVGARFTLDAMPGKQMSIDADMRAGVIDMDEARTRREKVTRESQLYGAMDGAMKFVKGDAIAGLIVISVNIIGGILIGTLQKGIPAGEAVKLYGILTIGDGLVSQIPALLISITAGIVVTRVSSEDSPNLGSEIGQQVMAQPKALMLGGGILLLMSLIPGFPKPQFVALAALLGGLGFILYRASKAPEVEEEHPLSAMAPATKKDQAPKKAEAGDEFSLTVPLLVDVTPALKQVIDPQDLNNELISVRRALYNDLGVPFPGIHLRYNESLSENSYMILLNEIPMSEGKILPGKLFVRESAHNLNVLEVPYETGDSFLPGLQTIWVDASYAQSLKDAGVPAMGASLILTYHLSFILKRNAEEFLGLQEAKFLLEKMEIEFPELVKEVQRALPNQKFSEVLRRLAQEEISIRNLRSILESLVEWGQKEKDPILLTEYCRIGLKRYISYRYSGGHNMLSVYLLDPAVEDTIRDAIRHTSTGSYLALAPDISKRFLDTLKKEIGDFTKMSQKPVLLTSMDLRRYVRKLIEMDFYELPVLSYQELTPEISVQPLGRIKL